MFNNPKVTRWVIIIGLILLVALLAVIFVTSLKKDEAPEATDDFYTNFPDSTPREFSNDVTTPLEIVDTNLSDDSDQVEFKPDLVEVQTTEFIPDEVDGGGYSDSDAAIAYLNSAKSYNQTPAGGNATTFEYSPQMQAILDTIQNNPEAIFTSPETAQYFQGWTPGITTEDFLNSLDDGDRGLFDRVEMETILNDIEDKVISGIDISGARECGMISVGFDLEDPMTQSEFEAELAKDQSAMCFGQAITNGCQTATVDTGDILFLSYLRDGECSTGLLAKGYVNLCPIDTSLVSSGMTNAETATLVYKAIYGLSEVTSLCRFSQYYR